MSQIEPIQQIISLINSEKNCLPRTNLKDNDSKMFPNIYPNSNKIIQYRTLIFKPWSGNTNGYQHEYQVKQQNMPEQLIKQQENEQESIEQLNKLKNDKLISNNQIIESQNGYYFRFQSGYVKLIKCLLQENGFKQCPDHAHKWSLYWSCTPIKPQIYEQLLPYQKIR